MFSCSTWVRCRLGAASACEGGGQRPRAGRAEGNAGESELQGQWAEGGAWRERA